MEKLNYKISSRATILLGRESMSRIDSAVIELVKNTLDARKSRNPTAVTHAGESWTVRNAQGYGVVSISRVYNPSIVDMSSREGLIENDTYAL